MAVSAATSRLRRFVSDVRRPSWIALLAATMVGVYLLVIAGATTAMADGAAACSGWPTCDGRWIVLETGPMAVAWLHRLLAGIVAVLLLATVVAAIRHAPTTPVLTAVVGAGVLYPIQIAIGAYTAMTGAPVVAAGLHLGVGLVIVGILVIALGVTLDCRYRIDADAGVDTAGPVDQSAGGPVEPQPAIDTAQSHGSAASSSETDPIGSMDRLRAYGSLMKPRLMWLLCLVALAAMALAAGPSLSASVVIATLLGGVLAIGASGTFNHVLERDIDRRMDRTADRPLATYEVPVANAAAFGSILAAGSIGVFLLWVNLLAAVLAATAIVFYSIVYTVLLKPNTVQNTVIGGFAGALPAFIGWAAVTDTIGWPAVALATVIFCWTPAHFYNLALAYKADYARADIPMLPVVRGERTTRRHIVWYLGATLIAAAVLATVDGLGIGYAVATAAGGALFLAAVIHLHRRQTRAAAFRAFHASNAFLAVVLLSALLDALVG